jgi:hypothetical protein
MAVAARERLRQSCRRRRLQGHGILVVAQDERAVRGENWYKRHRGRLGEPRIRRKSAMDIMATRARHSVPIDGNRLWSDVMALAAITDPERPYTRRSFSPRFLEGRKWLAEKFAAAGLRVRIDAAGNLIGRIGGQEDGARTIMLGSHSDTVPSGGRFDASPCSSPGSRSPARWAKPASACSMRST